MKYIIVFIGLYLISIPVTSQDTVGIDNPNDPVLENEPNPNQNSPVRGSPNKETDSKETAVKQEVPAAVEESQQEQANASSESDFDVFRPSEDISEDLAVPFPIDI